MNYRKPLAILTLALVCTAPTLAQVDARFSNFAPFAQPRSATAIDVSVNGGIVTSELTYPNGIGYQNLGASGQYEIILRPSGAQSGGVSIDAQLPAGDYTFMLIGDEVRQPVQGLGLQDLNDPPASGAALRFLNATPYNDSTATISIRDESGNPAFNGLSNLNFGSFSNYLIVPAGTYDFRITNGDGTLLLANPEPISVFDGDVDTLVVIGNGVDEPVEITSLNNGPIPGGLLVDHTATGIWFDPATAGQGAQFMALPSENRLTGFFYTYDTAGQELVWYNFDSCNSAPGAGTCATPDAFDGVRADVTIYQTSGGIFNNPAPANLMVVGSGTIEFQDCDNATVTADFGNGAGTVIFDYTRLGERVECSSELAR